MWGNVFVFVSAEYRKGGERERGDDMKLRAPGTFIRAAVILPDELLGAPKECRFKALPHRLHFSEPEVSSYCKHKSVYCCFDCPHCKPAVITLLPWCLCSLDACMNADKHGGALS